MSDFQRTPISRGIALRWSPRLLSIIVNAVFLLIIFLALTNEDKPQGPAIYVLVLLVFAMVACFAAWRWQEAAVVLVVAALCLSLAAYSASQAFGLGSLSWLPAVLYGAPFLVVGVLFWLSGQRA